MATWLLVKPYRYEGSDVTSFTLRIVFSKSVLFTRLTHITKQNRPSKTTTRVPANYKAAACSQRGRRGHRVIEGRTAGRDRTRRRLSTLQRLFVKSLKSFHFSTLPAWRLCLTVGPCSSSTRATLTIFITARFEGAHRQPYAALSDRVCVCV